MVSKQVSTMLIPENLQDSGFDVVCPLFDAYSEVHLRSSLSLLHDAVLPAPFNHNVHHHGHWATAACGCLKFLPAEQLRGAYPHLSYSMELSFLLGTMKARGFHHP